jgi:hypothetical protein
MNQQEFLTAFHTCALTKAQWTHEAHIRMAWLYIKMYGHWQNAMPHVRQGIRQLNAKINHGMGYNETITQAYLQLVQERIEQGGVTETWEKFLQTNTDLFNWQEPILLSYYTREMIFSFKARASFVPPDIRLLP